MAAKQTQTQEFCYSVLKQSVARCSHSIGWHGIHNGSCDVLTDLLRRYIGTIGRTTSAYANLADRYAINISDVEQTFKDMNIDEKDLLEFVKNVEVDSLSPLPSLPVKRPLKHLYNGTERKTLRKHVITPTCVTVPEQAVEEEPAVSDKIKKENGNEESDMEEDNETKEEIEIWEKLPGYLPPLPKIRNNSKGELDDCESGILMDDDDVLSTKSDTNEECSKTHLSHLRDEDEGSRRSSVSDEIAGGGFAQLPTTFRRQSTVTSPTTPISVPHTPVLVPSAPFENAFSDPPSDPPPSVEHSSLIPKLPPEIDDKEIAETRLSPGLMSRSPSPKPKPLSSRPKPNLRLSITTEDQPELSQQMPQLHLMSPAAPPTFPQALPLHSSPPSLSPLSKSPPSLGKPLKPALHKLSSPQQLICKPIPPKVDLVKKSTRPHKEMQLKLKRVASPLGQVLPYSEAQVVSSQSINEPSISHETLSIPHQTSPSLSSSLSPSPLPSLSPVSYSPPPVNVSSPKPVSSSPLQSPSSPPLTPSCSPSVPSSPPPLESPYPPALQSTTMIDPSLHDLSLSSSTSLSSSADEESKLGSPLPSSLPPPLLYAPPINQSLPHVTGPSIFYTSSLSVPTSHHTEIFSTSSSDSPSPSSSSVSSLPISMTPPKLEVKSLPNVNVAVPRLQSQTSILATLPPAQTKSPLSVQEEEDSSEESDSSLELVKYSLDKKRGSPVGHFISKSLSPEDFSGPLTVSIKKLTNAPLEFPDTKEMVGKALLTTSTLTTRQNVNSIFLEQSKKSLKLSNTVSSPSVASTLIVSIDRDILMDKKRINKSISPFSTKITIPKIVLPDIGMDTSSLMKPGQSKGKGQKRELELSEIGLNPKRVRRHSPEVHVSPSLKDKSKKTPSQVQVDARVTRRTRSQASDDGSESSDGSGLKLKLKIPKPPTPSSSDMSLLKKKLSKSVKKSHSQSPLAAAVKGSSPVLAHSPRIPSPQPPVHSEKLFITSSNPKKVPSIKLPKRQPTISPPPPLSIPKSSLSLKASPISLKKGVNIKRGMTTGLIGDHSGPEIYICPICERPDDGTPMICCDNCDIWLHWRCVGLTQAPPENEYWYCSKCNAKKKRKRKK